GGLSNLNLDMSQVYDYRENAKGIFSGPFSYALSFTAFSAAPFLLAYALYLNRISYIVVATFIIVMLFAFTGHKFMLVSSVMIAAGYLLFLFRVNARRRWFYWGAALPVAIATSMSYLPQYEIVGSLFVRRIFFVPAQLNFIYYDFFSEAGHTYLSALLPFIELKPFAVDYGLAIGKFSGHEGANASNGFLATSYMHFGIWGMMAFSLIVGILIKGLDSLVRNENQSMFVVCASIVSYRVMLVELDLTTALLTGGVFLTLILLWLMLRSIDSAH
ncbi:MAG: hypothetical protein KDI36_16185, partial [Pseudomonadales bacterium]|nr:hypothetical protein [Pseudomonadales bacterium]